MKIGELAGFSVAENADENLNAKKEELEAIQSKLEAAKGHLEAKEKAEGELATANADLKAATDKVVKLEADLKAANDTLEAVTGERDTAKADLETANARVSELEEAAGIDPTNPGAGKKDDEDGNAATPWVNPNAAHNKFIKSIQAKTGI